ncbi:MAG: tetratricopeptide repeat protein [Saprospiraceae bacterium]|nr:tetratricopeptide repeat protein [Saprospiraceae bacterium]
MIQQILKFIESGGKVHRILLVGLVFLFYGNTLMNDFAVDDSIVITKNIYTKKGISGIPDILTKDTFRGFFKVEGKDKLVSGGRYRPLSLVAFAIVFQIFGSNALVFHLLNIICFALLGIVIYEVCKLLLEQYVQSDFKAISFLCSLFFVIHPIHTECVANIKGLDEILALLLSMTSFYFALRWSKSMRIGNLLMSLSAFMLALFAKENSISYLVLIPLGLYFFRNIGGAKSLKFFLFLLVPTFIFLYCRAQILGWNPIAGHSLELMNNPFLKFVNGRYIPFTNMEKLGTIFYTLIKYLGLLLFPHPLTYDYYPKHIELHSMGSLLSMCSLLIYSILIYWALKSINLKRIITFSITAFLIPLFIVSNLLFSVGTFMGERFIFMPSFGFALLLAYFFVKFLHWKSYLSVSILLLLIAASAFKTITRNRDWKNDMSLILHDIQISPNSAKLNTAVGGILLEKYMKEKNEKVLQEKVAIAKKHLTKAIAIHPFYFEAYQLLGNAHFLAKEYNEAIEKYNFIIKYQPDNKDASINQSLMYKELGRLAGMRDNNPSQALKYLETSLQLNPDDEETISLMGVANGVMGNYDKALEIFYSILKKNPQSADAYFNLYLTYLNKGDKQKAEENFQKATSIDPKILDKFKQKSQ